MTLRDLINQVTDNKMDLSEPFVELDYELKLHIIGEYGGHEEFDVNRSQVDSERKIIFIKE